jgi:hypothetical protein
VKPLVEFADPEVRGRGLLRRRVHRQPRHRGPGAITTAPPATRLADTHLQVELDGSFVGDYPATERATVRVNCYAPPGRRSDVKALASIAQGLLSIHPGDAAVFGTLPLVGRSSVITDPDTKNLMVWFTFRVNLRPIPVSI